MRSLIIKTTVICLLASALALFCIHDSQKTAKAVTTYWYKIPPNTCVINALDDDLTIAMNSYTGGDLRIIDNTSGYVDLEAYCPVNLPHGAVAKTLRIRDFQPYGLPAYTDVYATLYRRQWTGSLSTLTTASLYSTGGTYADGNFYSTINNESYQYLVRVRLIKESSATASPYVSMIEIKYEQ